MKLSAQHERKKYAQKTKALNISVMWKWCLCWRMRSITWSWLRLSSSSFAIRICFEFAIYVWRHVRASLTRATSPVQIHIKSMLSIFFSCFAHKTRIGRAFIQICVVAWMKCVWTLNAMRIRGEMMNLFVKLWISNGISVRITILNQKKKNCTKDAMSLCAVELIVRYLLCDIPLSVV